MDFVIPNSVCKKENFFITQSVVGIVHAGRVARTTLDEKLSAGRQSRAEIALPAI